MDSACKRRSRLRSREVELLEENGTLFAVRKRSAVDRRLMITISRSYPLGRTGLTVQFQVAHRWLKTLHRRLLNVSRLNRTKATHQRIDQLCW